MARATTIRRPSPDPKADTPAAASQQLPDPDFITATQPRAEPQAMSSDELVRWVDACRRESHDAMKDRLAQNRRNRDANLGRQDFSHKVKGQSREFLPKVHMAAEQFSAFIKRALTQFGRWYQVDTRSDIPNPPLREEQLGAMLDHFLKNIYAGNGHFTSLPTILSDGVKLALFESMIITKTHGELCHQRRMYVEPGEVLTDPETGAEQQGEERIATKDLWPWKLRVDLIRPDNYFPDPSGRGLYEIHETERDLYEIVDMAEQGIYDPAIVTMIHEDFLNEEEAQKERDARGQKHSSPPPGRKRVRLREYWGHVLNTDGLIEFRNIVMTVANEKYLIRPPEPNPFWHGMSPFNAVPLIRVPLSVHHVALYDDAVKINLLMNEMYNLIIDGGLAAVWGVRQIRLDELEYPEEVSGGIGQGATLSVKSSLPHGQKVLEQVSEGQVPQDAFAVFEMIGREFTQACLTNDIKLGSLPSREVTATEVNDASASQATTLDAICSDVENELLVRLLTKILLTILQHMEWIDAHEMVQAIGPVATYKIGVMSTAQRYAAFSSAYSFEVHGLSAVMTRARDFQRLMALLQAVFSNPLLLQEFMKKASGSKLLDTMMKMLNINPESVEITPEELMALPKTIEGMKGLMPITNPKAGGGRADGSGGSESGTAAEINQMENPMTGMGGGA